MLRSGLVALVCAACPALAQPVFEPRDIAPHVYGGGWEFFVGGGLSSFDCNGDGLPELYAISSTISQGGFQILGRF